MSDPTIANLDLSSILQFAEKGLYGIASALGLIAVLRWLSGIHLKALNARIAALERAFAESLERERETSKAAIKRAEEYALALHNASMKMSAAVRDMAAVQNRALTVFGDAMDRVGGSMPTLPPRASEALERKPSRHDLPAFQDPPTETIGGRK
jgi:hypothetical protein